MNCPQCHFQNPPGMKFCGDCGANLNATCADCSFENPPGFKYCGNCGSSLTGNNRVFVSNHADFDTGSNQPAIHADVAETEQGERRHLTVMFCDVVGSTELSHLLDPEDLRTIIKEYQSICASIIARYDGNIAQYLGDGLMVYFGYPTAHENDAHRAASSALGIVEAIRIFNLDIQDRFDVNIAVRIGIHTGNVVMSQIGGGATAQNLALGATPNIAARLEGLAGPGNVAISATTHQLIQSYFNCDSLGTHTLKGITTPMEVFRVVTANVAKYRYDSQMSLVDRKPLYGRDEEIMQLHALWELAGDGEAQVAAVHGEPGLGKSSVVEAVIRLSTEDAGAWVMFHQCSEYHTNSAFYPVAQAILHSALQVKPSDSVEEKVSRLEGFLLQVGYDLDEMMPLFAQIMSLPLTGTSYRPTPYSPDQQRQKLIDAVLYNFSHRSKDNRLLVIFEDLQWIDLATLEIITRLIDDCQGQKLLLLLTFRPEFKPPWGSASHVNDIALQHLRRNSSHELITRIAGHKRLPQELMDAIIAKTDGIPLFVEELTKTILNSNLVVEKDDQYVLDKPLSQISIPSTLHDSLEARLDRMSHTKEVAQVGASIGREFAYQLLVDASPMQEEAVRSCLAELVDAEILVQNGRPPDSSYQFRHGLIMDAAYASLLKSNRVIIHKRIAMSMAKNELYTDEIPEAIAHHFLKGKEYSRSVQYWTKAAFKARKYQSFEEALAHINKGLEVLEMISGEERARLESDLLEMKAPTHLAIESYGSSNAYKASLKLFELSNRLGDDSARFSALRTMVTYEVFSGRPDAALIHAEEAQELADKIGTADVRIEAMRLSGQAAMYVGRYNEAVSLLDASFEAFDKLPEAEKTVANRNQGILSLVQSSHCMWYRGFPEQAIERGERAVRLASDHGKVNTTAMVCFLHSINCSYLGHWTEALEIARKGLEISDEYGLRMFSSEIRFVIGWIKSERGQGDEGVEMMHSSIKWRTSAGLFSAIHLQTSILASKLIDLGRYPQAGKIIERSMKLIELNEDQFFRSEVYRVAAILEFKLHGGQSREKIEQLIAKSFQIARAQGTRSFELRTGMTALELSQTREEIISAAANLKDIYSSFSEGLESVDLMHAAQLLEDYSDIPRPSQ